MNNPLSGLNAEQKKAAAATHGPVLVLAGAGSGKTRTLTHRIAYLIQKGIALPHQILAVTFTNKAAKEMQTRLNVLLGGQTMATIGTFHSLGVRILRQQASYLPRSNRFSIFDSQDSERLVKQAFEEAGISQREWNPRHIKADISRAKNSMTNPAELKAAADSPKEELTAKIYARYEALLAKNDAYDFDDLLIAPIKLLRDKEEIRRQYQNRWRFLSVDEYQDTNPPQEQLLNLLLNEEKNICAVGDDYQAIYSWRGAKVDHILRFNSKFPNCKTIYLTQNYRSSPAILEAANRIIAANVEQKHKKLWTSASKGAPVDLVSLDSDKQEASWIRQQVEEHRSQGGALSDCVVLYRTNAQSRLFEEEWLKHHIPYTIVGGYRFYERKEVKDALAFLQLWVNPNSLLSVRRLIGTFVKGIGPKTIAKWDRLSENKNYTLEKVIIDESGQRPSLAPFAKAYNQARNKDFATVADLLRYLLSKSGYLAWLKKFPDGEERLENIEELFNVAAGFSDASSLLEEVSLLTDIDNMEKATDRVLCMTLHAAKGLEFPRVFLAGCEESLLPHINSIDTASKLEEERRLLYVGMTRAEKKLTLTHALTRSYRGEVLSQMPSRFLQDLPDNVQKISGQSAYPDNEFLDTLSFAAAKDPQEKSSRGNNEAVYVEAETGDFVSHPVFGQGVVIGISGSLLTCVFEGHGVKTIDGSTIKV